MGFYLRDPSSRLGGWGHRPVGWALSSLFSWWPRAWPDFKLVAVAARLHRSLSARSDHAQGSDSSNCSKTRLQQALLLPLQGHLGLHSVATSASLYLSVPSLRSASTLLNASSFRKAPWEQGLCATESCKDWRGCC